MNKRRGILLLPLIGICLALAIVSAALITDCSSKKKCPVLGRMASETVINATELFGSLFR